MIILTIDIGGTHVKLRTSNDLKTFEFESGPAMTPGTMVREIVHHTAAWSYDAISIGYPGVVAREQIVGEPPNLGEGWVGFDFGKAFGRPVKIINDAAMQALGSYAGGCMLFLGLGTGLGSAMVFDGRILPMELAHLPYRKNCSFEGYVGTAGLKRLGEDKWRKHVWIVVDMLRKALQPDYVVLGGGNVKRLGQLPPGVHPGDNANAFTGGYRLWQTAAGGDETPADPADHHQAGDI